MKKAEYTLDLPELLTKKKKKNWSEKYPKKNETVTLPNRSNEDLNSCNYAEIVWKNGAYWFCYSVQVPKKHTSSYLFKVAGGDLGEIHAVTVATADKALLLSGRAMRSIAQFRSKALADLNKRCHDVNKVPVNGISIERLEDVYVRKAKTNSKSWNIKQLKKSFTS
ncbi:hypothetical protein ACI2OX_03320 [Bacillus sp. N9]